MRRPKLHDDAMKIADELVPSLMEAWQAWKRAYAEYLQNYSNSHVAYEQYLSALNHLKEVHRRYKAAVRHAIEYKRI